REQRIAKWQQINHEDHEILRGLQVGLRSSFYQSGMLAPPRLEGCISHFHDYLARTLDGRLQ
ncbi:MAG: SRPBCC family protein, partial [Pseudomonadota bacterium]